MEAALPTAMVPSQNKVHYMEILKTPGLILLGIFLPAFAAVITYRLGGGAAPIHPDSQSQLPGFISQPTNGLGGIRLPTSPNILPAVSPPLPAKAYDVVDDSLDVAEKALGASNKVLDVGTRVIDFGTGLIDHAIPPNQTPLQNPSGATPPR